MVCPVCGLVFLKAVPAHGVAIVQVPGGQRVFKAFGPRSAMEKWQEAFTDMVDSFKPAQE